MEKNHFDQHSNPQFSNLKRLATKKELEISPTGYGLVSVRMDRKKGQRL